MAEAGDHLPDDTDALKAALIEARAKLVGAQALIDHLQLVIAKMQREKFGPRSERSQRLIDQLELQLEELAAALGEDETKAEAARVKVQGFTRRQATRRNDVGVGSALATTATGPNGALISSMLRLCPSNPGNPRRNI